MIVKKCEVVKIEAIVRGYITGTFPATFFRHSNPRNRLSMGGVQEEPDRAWDFDASWAC